MTDIKFTTTDQGLIEYYVNAAFNGDDARIMVDLPSYTGPADIIRTFVDRIDGKPFAEIIVRPVLTIKRTGRQLLDESENQRAAAYDADTRRRCAGFKFR